MTSTLKNASDMYVCQLLNYDNDFAALLLVTFFCKYLKVIVEFCVCPCFGMVSLSSL